MFTMVLVHAHGCPPCAGLAGWFTHVQAGAGFLTSCALGLHRGPWHFAETNVPLG